jgi:Cdc6-like AAA superfamily ATPase
MKNPFTSNFESFEGPMSPLVKNLHGDKFDQLKGLISGEEGVLVSLRAPRAGYGKTMLLSRLREEMQDVSVMVPIDLSADSRINEKDILVQLIDQFTSVLPGKRNLTRLDFSMRRILANALIPLVESGEVPSPNRTESLRSLSESPEQVFDFHKDSAAVAQWVRNQFPALSPRFVWVIGQRCGGVTSDLSQWFSVLSQFAMAPVEERNRNQDLLNEIDRERGQLKDGVSCHGVLTSFLKLMTITENIVLVVDEMDGLFCDSEAALRVANTLIGLRQAAPRIKVIFSVNDDVWESTFSRRIPLGMQDRFEDSVIRLQPLDEGNVSELLRIRHADGAKDLRQKLDLNDGDLYPRAILRAARDVIDSQATSNKLAVEQREALDGNLRQTKDIGFAELSLEKVVETDLTESGRPDVPFANPIVKNKYPPGLVRRVMLPRKYLVQRIRQETDSVRFPPAPPLHTSFESPFRLADSSKFGGGKTSGTSVSLPANEDKNSSKAGSDDSDSIDELLRKFRER